MTQIAVLVGSLRKDSWNKKFAQAVEAALPAGTSFVYADIALPLYDTDLEAEFPQAAQAVKDIVEASDGVFIVTPEYNRSIPGVLKNAIDWASRPWGKNSFAGKPTVLAGVSVGAIGTAVAQAELRNVMVYLDTKLAGQPEAYLQASTVFDESGNISEGSRQFVSDFAAALVAHVQGVK